MFTRVALHLTIFHNFHCFIPSLLLSMGNSSFTYVIDLNDVIIMFLLLPRLDTSVRWPMWHVMKQFARVRDESL